MDNYKLVAALIFGMSSAAHAGVTVTLTAPSNGAVHTEFSNITVSASASASGGYTMSKVEFFQGSTLLGTDTTSPYSFTWNNVQAGPYAIKAIATAVKKSNPDQTATSAVANIVVNARPTVTLTSPYSASIFLGPANIAVSATASDSDGSISKVEFLQGAIILATVTNPPYSFNWTGVPAGVYTVRARATDNNNAVSGDDAAQIKVTSSGPQLHFVHVDHLNTPRLIENQSQQAVWRWDQQEPFGNSVPDQNPSGLGSFEFPLRFPGQYYDKEWNLSYNYFRDYDPSIGRFIQSDPMGLGAGINTYSYVGSEPLYFIDPLGLSFEGAWTSVRDVYRWTQGNLGTPAYGVGDAVTKDLMNTPVMEDIRKQLREANCRDGVYCGDFQYKEFFTTFNVVGHTVGSFCATITFSGNTMMVDAWNDWGLESGTRLPAFPGFGGNRKNSSVEQIVSGQGSPFQWPKSVLENKISGTFATSRTRYRWTEPSACCR